MVVWCYSNVGLVLGLGSRVECVYLYGENVTWFFKSYYVENVVLRVSIS